MSVSHLKKEPTGDASVAPLVSIVCVSHNHRAYIEEALRSLIDQDYPNVEVIFVDNGSTDGTKEVALQVLQAGSRPFQCITNSRNENVSKAFNQGVAAARGEYISIISGDDRLHANKTSRNMQAARERAHPVIVASHCAEIDPTGRYLRRWSADVPANRELHLTAKMMRRCLFAAHTLLIPKSCFAAVGGFDETLCYEDWDMWMRMSMKFPFVYLAEELADYRKIPTSLTATIQKDKKMRTDILIRLKCLGVSPRLTFIALRFTRKLLIELRTLNPAYFEELHAFILARLSVPERVLFQLMEGAYFSPQVAAVVGKCGQLIRRQKIQSK